LFKKYFPFISIYLIAISYDIKKWKPLPDLYLHAAQKMGVAPSKCIVVEDSLAGVQAAKAAGMFVYGYAGASDGKQLEEAGTKVIYNMEKLIQFS